MPRIRLSSSSSLAYAYYSLDNKVKGRCGHTERTRIKNLVMIACQITSRTWYRWLEKPADVRNSDRVTISLLFNMPIAVLFAKQTKLAPPDIEKNPKQSELKID
jgi:hypothetical protein